MSQIRFLGMKVVTTQPRRPDSMVIRKRAERAARNTVSLLFLMARMAAMKKVLSPISETRMTEMDSVNPWRIPRWWVEFVRDSRRVSFLMISSGRSSIYNRSSIKELFLIFASMLSFSGFIPSTTETFEVSFAVVVVVKVAGVVGVEVVVDALVDAAVEEVDADVVVVEIEIETADMVVYNVVSSLLVTLST